jgi:hypothetical protein
MKLPLTHSPLPAFLKGRISVSEECELYDWLHDHRVAAVEQSTEKLREELSTAHEMLVCLAKAARKGEA